MKFIFTKLHLFWQNSALMMAKLFRILPQWVINLFNSPLIL